MPTRAPRFQDVTETAGTPMTPEARSMVYTRYHVAAAEADGKRVLEIACGSGHGLGLLAERAATVVGGDYSAALLAVGRRHYGDRMPLVRFSAERLPFANAAFDLVLFFEASYYVPDMEAGFDEAVRVLAPGGTLLFVNANPERPDFIHSPYSVRYHTADEFRRAGEARGLRVTVAGAFPVEPPATGTVARLKGRVFSSARRVLEALRLVPRTLKGRARLKRMIYGKLDTLPAELPRDYAPVAPRHPVGAGPVRGYKVIYVRGDKPT